MKRIITAVIASILVIMTAATLSGCKNENAPLTGTKVYKFAAEKDPSTNLPYKVSFKVGDAKKKISEIWVNIDNMKLETTFKANAVNSSSWTAKSSSYKTFNERRSQQGERRLRLDSARFRQQMAECLLHSIRQYRDSRRMLGKRNSFRRYGRQENDR